VPHQPIDDFPAPHLAVDVAVMTVSPDEGLSLLLHRRTGDRSGQWALPGRFVRPRERLAHAVLVTLQEKCGLTTRDLRGRVPRQLHLFDDPDRDDRGWVMSAAHLLGMPHRLLADLVAKRPDVVLAPLDDDRVRVSGQKRLPYGQDEIVRYAVAHLRECYRKEPDPQGLLESDTFTLAELHAIHLAVIGQDWQVDTFRRHMLPILRPTGDLATGRPGRPAATYQRA
jgi:8-oxo-dGTP diphosphatase